MDFFKLLQSLDELLYEIMSWLIFYPITLWRAVTRPRVMMDYANAELGDAAERQYTDTLNPPLFLIVTLLVSHAIELSTVGENAIVGKTTGLAALIDSDTNLMLLRIVMFSLFPLIMAAHLVRRQSIGLDRDTLRPPFYSQCYVTAPFALLLGIGSVLLQQPLLWVATAGLVLCGLALIWYGTLQIDWFARHLNVSRWRGFLHASLVMIESIAATLIVTFLFA